MAPKRSAAKPRPQKELGERIRSIRIEKGLSQMDLVRRFDWSLSHYQKIERGVLDPRFTTLEKLADSFDMPVSDLLKGL